MPDITFNQFPISGKIVDFDQLNSNIEQAQSDIADKASKSTTINGYDLSEDRTIYAQDVPSKNLLPNTASTKTENGVTFTRNDDGSITVNGTASATTYCAIYKFSASETESLNGLILTGCPSGGSDATYSLCAQEEILPYGYLGVDYGDGVTLGSSSLVSSVFIRIGSGTTVNNLKFRPQIRRASDPEGYVPYAKSNVELSANTLVRTGTVTVTRGTNYSSETVIRRQGNVVYLRLGITGLPTSGTELPVATIPQEFRPTENIRCVGATGAYLYQTYTSCYVIVTPNGEVNIYRSSTSHTCFNMAVSWIIG